MADDLGFYFHVPFCKHACPYCDFYKMELRDRPARERLDFPARLAREHALLLDAEPDLARRPLATLYFGGGTPSTLVPSGVADLIRAVRERHPASEPEVTLEANPENLTPARCEAWARAGVTRLSIGVQSFRERDLARLERLHGPKAIGTAVRNARAAGITNLSLDLMFALPDQTLAEWLEDLDRAVALEPDHLSFYGLTYHEGTPFEEWRRVGNIAEADEDLYAEMYLRGARLLAAAGFDHYEISNFARPGRRSLHNQRYWNAQDVVGFGPGAHSSLGARRWHNPDDLDQWRADLAAGRLPRTRPQVLDASHRLEEELFRRLRRCEGFRLSEGLPADAHFANWLTTPRGRQALDSGWIERSGDRARLTLEGWLRSDALLIQML
ncbi:MAG: radical SAM family heme chaperone HemW [Candidatus Sumerlaeia bacterium]|nr:radical SAM family heme chaperone HemW [Candidatus Sumerlaeia bacterium]